MTERTSVINNDRLYEIMYRREIFRNWKLKTSRRPCASIKPCFFLILNLLRLTPRRTETSGFSQITNPKKLGSYQHPWHGFLTATSQLSDFYRYMLEYKESGLVSKELKEFLRECPFLRWGENLDDVGTLVESLGDAEVLLEYIKDRADRAFELRTSLCMGDR